MIVRIQALVAIAVPWLAAHVLVPDSLWVLVTVAVPVLFALLHARSWQAWLAPVSGAISAASAVPWWGSGVLAIAAAGVLLVWPPLDVVQPSRRAWLLGSAGVMVVAGLVLATVALVDIRKQDAAFDAGQAVAAEAWATAEPEDENVDPLAVSGDVPLVGEPMEVQAEAAEPVRPPFARMRFVRKGTNEPVVTDRVLYVGPDVTDRGLAAGPGHYPQTGRPGRPGNIAIAGHRTGWGSPFLHLDDLEPGDRIKIVDRKGVRHTYVVRESRLVAPTADWVLGPDPLGSGEPTLTLTTCDPPEINTERLIVFATLAKSVPLPSA